MTLKDLLRDLTPDPVPAMPVTGIACHSKQVRRGELFIAVKGTSSNGHQFVHEATQRGACAVVVEDELPRPVACPVIRVKSTHDSIATIAARFYGTPVSKLRLVGITGTCGKTTTAYLTKAMLEAAHQRVGLLGTVAYEIGQRYVPSTNTTPGPVALQQLLAQMVEQGLGWCAMEVSSHALDQRRIDGLSFDAAVWTSLGSDHLDYHKTLERYAEAKRKLFSYVRDGGHAIINMDDAYGQTLVDTLPSPPVITYGIEREAMVRVKVLDCAWHGMKLLLESPWGGAPITTPMTGRHNAANIAAAAAACLGLGVPAEAIARALADFAQVPGRLERVPNDAGLHIVIDFAHTADALQRMLTSLRELVRGRLIVVFGCGGDRDQIKRPAMGKVASLLADYVIVTADNPRSEEPRDIATQIESGFVPTFRQYAIIIDREEAIARALAIARPDDAVVIAGKGHEAYQIFHHVATPFSDRDVVERCLTRSGKTITVS